MMVYLSICIPTYNRKNYLQNTLDSIISQKIFTSGQIEIIVSDNASIDGTEEMVQQFIASSPYIRYYRNETNEGVNVNIYKALNYGTGLYRKICNDTYVFNEASLGWMVESIKLNASEKPFILFSNTHLTSNEDSIKVDNLDQFVRIVSYNLTNDTVVGFWDNELPSITLKDTSTWFWGIHAILKIVNLKKNVIIYNFELYTVAVPKNKDLTYGLIKVFYKAYFKCFEPYIGKEIQNTTYQKERRKLLYTFFLLWFVNKDTSTNFRFSQDDTIQNLRIAYDSPLLLFSILLKLKVLKKKIGILLRKAGILRIG